MSVTVPLPRSSRSLSLLLVLLLCVNCVTEHVQAQPVGPNANSATQTTGTSTSSSNSEQKDAATAAASSTSKPNEPASSAAVPHPPIYQPAPAAPANAADSTSVPKPATPPTPTQPYAPAPPTYSNTAPTPVQTNEDSASGADVTSSPTELKKDEEEQEKEKRDVKYVVGLLRSASTGRESEQPGSKIVWMTSKSGKRFKCTLPDPTKEPIAPPPEAIVPVDTQVTPSPPVQPFHDIVPRVRKTLGDGCFTKGIDYWTYEVCPFKSVRQYHKDGERITMEFKLGDYVESLDEINVGRAAYLQHYRKGADNRQSVVKFVCNTDPNPSENTKHLLITVQEPKPFWYEFEIKSTLACASSTHSSPLVAGETVPTGAPTLNELLSSLQDDCLTMNAGWWTYKFCYLKEITQFHRETVPVNPTAPAKPGAQVPMKVVTTAEFHLGYYQTAGANIGSVTTTQPESTKIVRGDTPELSYVSQLYTGGTKCDIGAGKARSTEVKMFCDLNEKQPIIKSMVESATCEYVMTIHTPYICAHPAFKPKAPQVHEIVCEPITQPNNVKSNIDK